MRYLMIQAGLFGAVAIMSFLFSLPYGIALAVLGLCLITIPFTAGYSTPSRYGIYLDDAARAEIRYSVERAQYRMSLTLVNHLDRTRFSAVCRGRYPRCIGYLKSAQPRSPAFLTVILRGIHIS